VNKIANRAARTEATYEESSNALVGDLGTRAATETAAASGTLPRLDASFPGPTLQATSAHAGIARNVSVRINAPVSRWSRGQGVDSYGTSARNDVMVAVTLFAWTRRPAKPDVKVASLTEIIQAVGSPPLAGHTRVVSVLPTMRKRRL
jgi:hypothetical protein